MVTLSQVRINSRQKIDSYKEVDSRHYNNLMTCKDEVRSLKVVHINSSASGGGVAELLHSQVNLERSLGMDSRWFVIEAPSGFFRVTKKIHNLLQGKKDFLTEGQKQVFSETSKLLRRKLEQIAKKFSPDIIVIHDPQPIALVEAVPPGIKKILRLHIDLSQPETRALEFINPYLKQFDTVIVSNADYLEPIKNLTKSDGVIMPAIDPLAPKNLSISKDQAQAILRKLGIDPLLPIITQVSRFDDWKNPSGLVRSFESLQKSHPDIQLVLAGFITAPDDPEAEKVFRKIRSLTEKNHNVHLFSDPDSLGSISNDEFINALYTLSTAIVQNSLREGFGLTVTEAMWKGKPVVTGPARGFRLQIDDRHNGFLTNNDRVLTKVLDDILKFSVDTEKVGKAARASVGDKFLILRFVLENLQLYLKVLKEK